MHRLRFTRSLPRVSSLFQPIPRTYATGTSSTIFDPSSVERPTDEVDVLIVGAGPAGLSAAIRLKQLEREKGNEIRVVVLEKASEVGAHIVSGAVIEPRALNELLPNWKSHPSNPLKQPSTSSSMIYLTPTNSLPLPHPPQMNNDGNYIVSLSQVTRWLAAIAEDDFGVEIYPGFAGASLVFSDQESERDTLGRTKKRVIGVRTNDIGLSKDYQPKEGLYEPGMEFRARLTLLAEGAHGSLTKMAIPYYGLRKGKEDQTYGMGVKEVWQFQDPEMAKKEGRYVPGKVVHTMGYPLDSTTYGGGWAYHMEDGMISLGLVVGCDWKNPSLSPYRELQRLKHHPYYRNLLLGNPDAKGTDPSTHKNPAKRIQYGARTLTEGGLRSVPSSLHFPGGGLIGCSAGFMNVPKIKGTHGAMKSGMLAAESAYDTLSSSSTEPGKETMESYTQNFEKSWLWKELWEVRNIRRSFDTSLGVLGGVMWSGLDSMLFKGGMGSGKMADWLFPTNDNPDPTKFHSPDAQHTMTTRSTAYQKIEYPPFEPPLSTDLMSSVALTGTNHEEDTMVHLRVTGALDPSTLPTLSSPKLPEGNTFNPDQWMYGTPISGEYKSARSNHVKKNIDDFDGLLGVACPAGVYEYVDAEEDGIDVDEGSGQKKLVINSQNCIHCKLCDIKVPTQDITWTVPQGGGGPKYTLT